MRGSALALLLVFGMVSAVTSTFAALAKTDKSACQVESSDGDETGFEATFHRVMMVAKRTLP